MKSRKLNEAFNYVEDTYLEITEQEKGSHRPAWIRWTAIAACICILAGIGLPMLRRNPSGHMDYNGVAELAAPSLAVGGRVLAGVSYPVMAPYPNEMDYVDEKTGKFDNEAFSEAHDPWCQDRWEMHRQPEGYAEGLDGFFNNSMAVFLSDADGENRLYSPLNVYLALSMLAEVTDGDSRAQILDALGADSVESLRNQVESVWKAHYYNDGSTTSILADSLWLSDGMEYNMETLNRLTEHYFASSFSGEMGSEGYNRMLQSWLNEQTGGLLEEYTAGETMSPETVLALASTVYFRCKWDPEFQPSRTENGIFHKTDGTEVSAGFMNQSEQGYYYWSEKFGAVQKRLEDGFSMWLLLPDEGIAPEALLGDGKVMELIGNHWDSEKETWSWTDNKYLIINLSLPKFDVSSRISLLDGLGKLGITDAADRDLADFTPLTEESDGIFLSDANHAVRVAVDEEGVTAAAYTVMMAAGAAEPPKDEIDFVLDRPFLFVITSPDNLPVFAGIVNDPQ